jgi:radical SAM family uncharacterized protein/radical SAM-linked protein
VTPRCSLGGVFPGRSGSGWGWGWGSGYWGRMNLSTVLNDEILPRVEKASRYLGTEVNAVHKDPSKVDVRLVLTFPDLYDIGLGNLGLHILYAVVNQLPWAWAERAYAPAVDMEQELRARGLPLFALESKDPISAFDGLGFTLQTELTFTNILNCIDLAGIPLRTKDRREGDPLTFAGGPAVFNPEPLAPFMDFFVIGDGEDAILEIAEVLRKMKGKPRKSKLLALSLIEGVYVPALYPFETLPNGQIVPKQDAPKIRKRITRDLNGATYPVDYIVPFTKQVHDRLNLEVLRGCTQGCRFCQAGMVTRPVRERSLENLDKLLERTLDSTGYEEVSLVSLSTCDYSRVRALVEQTVDRARPQHVAVSLPSLRLDSYSVELSDMVAETRKTGITFAPEAASPRLRQVINKWIPDEELLSMSSEVYARGWDLVKLYFMIGLPTERDEDIEAIADLCRRTWLKGKDINGRARVNLGVSTFVPKPFTPFQWAQQIDAKETQRRQEVLWQALGRNSAIKFGRHDPEETFLEGLLGRADRRAGDLLELAWKKGCRFDAWREHLRFDLWMQAVEELGYDVQDALRERSVDERLPWDHIDCLIDKQWFVEDWQRAKVLEHAPDCRQKKCHKCGVIDHERELCASMLRKSIEGRKTEKQWVAAHAENPRQKGPRVEPPPAQRLWFRVGRTGPARYLAHLEAMNAWIRSLRRARAPLAYTQGFHPHPRIAFSTAPPLGEESLGDHMDVVLAERVDPAVLMDRLKAVLPQGFDVIGVREVPVNAPSLMAVARGASYTVFFPREDRAALEARLAELVARPTIVVQREGKAAGKRGGRMVRDIDIKPMIRKIAMHPGEVPAIDVTFVDVEKRPGKPKELVALLATVDPDTTRVLKRETLLMDEATWATVAPEAAPEEEVVPE